VSYSPVYESIGQLVAVLDSVISAGVRAVEELFEATASGSAAL